MTKRPLSTDDPKTKITDYFPFGSSSTPLNSAQTSYDIGNYMKKNEINDHKKAGLLENHWEPPSNHSIFTKNRRKKMKIIIDKSYFKNFDWLVLSKKDEGFYCKYCAIYYFNKDSRSNLPSRLVKAPLKIFENLFDENGPLKKHERNVHHRNAVEDGEAFLQNYHKSLVVISNDPDNKERLRPIVKTIIFCGHQNIPLRGNIIDDEETIIIDHDDTMSSSEENFIALLNFRLEFGDTKLQHHLETSDMNATLNSETVKNKLINICMEIIQKNISENVKKAKYFSILFDEATDLFHNTQLCLFVRYLHNNSIMEDFLTFCNTNNKPLCDEMTGNGKSFGVALAEIVEDVCNKFDIDLKLCVGIGIDNCSVMNPEAKKAVVQHLTEKAVNAKRCPSSNYILNNLLSLTSCRNATITMKKVIQFANASLKRQIVFQKELEESAKGIWKANWDEMHDGHLLFQGNNLISIFRALQAISKWTKKETANEAHFLLQILISSDFIISSICLNDVLGTTVTLSKILQSPSSAIEFKRASEAIENARTVLLKKREHTSEKLTELVQEVIELAKELGVELNYIKETYPQTSTAFRDPGDTSVLKHYICNVYNPILDTAIETMSLEFIDLLKLRVFLPKKKEDTIEQTIESNNNDLLDVKELASNYASLIGNAPETEYELWKVKWQNTATIPQTLSEAIKECDEILYPDTKVFLSILAVLPVSKLRERSFLSTRLRLKTWLRSSTTKDHLTGLALLYIYRNVEIDVENVIELFMRH